MIRITKTPSAIEFEARLRKSGDDLSSRAGELAMLAAEHLANEIKDSILNQTASFAPASPKTKKSDPRLLIETQKYVESIEAVETGGTTAAVKMDPIGLHHEYGTKNMPARPHIAPAIAKSGERGNTQVKVRLEKIFRELLGG